MSLTKLCVDLYLGNAAFCVLNGAQCARNEVGRILRRLASEIEECGIPGPHSPEHRGNTMDIHLRDLNGNDCGIAFTTKVKVKI